MKNIALIGAPVDLGSSELDVRDGPSSFRKIGASNIFSRAGFGFEDLGDISVSSKKDAGKKIKNLDGIVESAKNIKSMVLDSLDKGQIPLTVGGDHSIALGSVSASLDKYPELNLLWIDAHPDINIPETTPSGNVHGMVTSSLMGYGNEQLTSLSKNKLKPENLYFLGVKDADKEEEKIIKKLNIYSLSINDILLKGFGNATGDLFEKLVDKKVHVSLDLDSIDILDAPGVGIPSRGGFDYREIKYIAEQISKLDVVAMDVVELNPALDIDNRTARLAVELAVTCLDGSYSLYYDYLEAQK